MKNITLNLIVAIVVTFFYVNGTNAEVAISTYTGEYFTNIHGFPPVINKSFGSASGTYWDFFDHELYSGIPNENYTGVFDRTYSWYNASGVPKNTVIEFNSFMDDYWADLVMVYERIPNADIWVMTGIVTCNTGSECSSNYYSSGVYNCVYNTGDFMIRVKKISPDDYMYNGEKKRGVWFTITQY